MSNDKIVHISEFQELRSLAKTIPAVKTVLALTAETNEGLRAQQQAVSITNTIMTYEETIKALRKRNAAMQTLLDANADNVMTDLKELIASTETAYGAFNLYGVDWFVNQPYSDLKIQQIAQTLINLTSPYTGKVNQFWQKLVDGDFSSLDADDEPTKVRKITRLASND